MSAAVAWPFLATVLVLEITPGPNMGYLAAVTLRDGWRAGAITILGVTVGLTICLLASIGGLMELVAAQPLWLSALKWIGVAYFAWLALDAWASAGRAIGHGAAPRTRLFMRGVVSNLLNPKAALLYLALLPGFLTPNGGSLPLQALTLGSIHIGVSVAVHLLIVVFSAMGRRALDSGAGAHVLPLVQRGSALLLLAVAGWLAAS